MESKCHCGNVVASIAEPGNYINPNMINEFCGFCISVRCDAFPGACNIPTDPQDLLNCESCQ